MRSKYCEVKAGPEREKKFRPAFLSGRRQDDLSHIMPVFCSHKSAKITIKSDENIDISADSVIYLYMTAWKDQLHGQTVSVIYNTNTKI